MLENYFKTKGPAGFHGITKTQNGIKFSFINSTMLQNMDLIQIFFGPKLFIHALWSNDDSRHLYRTFNILVFSKPFLNVSISAYARSCICLFNKSLLSSHSHLCQESCQVWRLCAPFVLCLIIILAYSQDSMAFPYLK